MKQRVVSVFALLLSLLSYYRQCVTARDDNKVDTAQHLELVK